MKNTLKGIILEIDSDLSRVYSFDDYRIIECSAKGNLKKQDKSFLVGDYVLFTPSSVDKGHIIEIMPRNNSLFRPKIANIDNVLLVTSLIEPLLNTYLLDKYLAFLEIHRIEPILIFTKVDLPNSNKDELLEKVNAYQKMGYQTFLLDNKQPDPILLTKLANLMEKKLSVFAGQTGAGKTSTLNNFLAFEDQQKTNSISKALNRGRHTTTNTKIYVINQTIFLADSPGFSSFSLKGISLEELRSAFRVFEKYQNNCKFNDCLHLNEVDCMVKKQVDCQEIPLFFYDDYTKIVEELKREEVSS